MSTVTLPEEELDQYIGEEPQMNLNASEVNDGVLPVCQCETKPSGHSLNLLQSLGVTYHCASSLLPVLKDLVPLLF